MKGDIRAADLSDLFLIMRAESGGSGVVSEIANFIAHPEPRTQGLVWKNARDAFAILKLWAWVELYPIKTRDVPAWVQESVRANLRRMRKSGLRKWTGLNRSQATLILDRILSRQVSTAPGRLTKFLTKSPEEARVLECCIRYITGGSLFTDDSLFNEFSQILLRNGLIEIDEKQALVRAKPGISLFALISMHNRRLDLGDGISVSVAITEDMRGNLGAFAVSEVAAGGPMAAIWLLETALSIRDYCDNDVAPPYRTAFVGDFELTPEVRLGRI